MLLCARRPNHLRVVAVSDTHNDHARLRVPEGDVFVHAGDATDFGTAQELIDFYTWMASLDHPIKLFIPGNHDIGLDPTANVQAHCFWTVGRHNSTLEVARSLRATSPPVRAVARAATLINDWRCLAPALNFIGVSGTPSVVNCCPMAFAGTAPRLRLPEQVYALVSHAPPAGILDNSGCGSWAYGSDAVRALIRKTKPRLHIFGHVHLPRGGVHFTRSCCFMNVSMGSDAGVSVIDVPLDGGPVALPVWRCSQRGARAFGPRWRSHHMN
jgi:hypothetical protein